MPIYPAGKGRCCLTNKVRQHLYTFVAKFRFVGEFTNAQTVELRNIP